MICSTITITATGVSQQDGASAGVTIPREEIRMIKLSHDSRSRRPFLRFFIGFVLAVTGLVLITAAFMMAEGGVAFVRMKPFALGIPVLPIALWLLVGAGLWLILGVFRGRYNLLITADQGTRKLFFEESTDISEILSFIRRANRELGYAIDTSITETMYIRQIPDKRHDSEKT